MTDRTDALRGQPDAALILGPTGSGKSPLGDLLQKNGLRGRTCHHFDFGARLRSVTEQESRTGVLTVEEVEHVRSLLRGGALLEDDRFPIAEKILLAFLEERGVGPRDLVVLNGLPRHVGQARALERILRVVILVSLEAEADTIYGRIETNVGGDRTGRTDDERSQIHGKLEIHEARTRPLLQWYSKRGATVHLIPIGLATTSEDVVAVLSGHCDL